MIFTRFLYILGMHYCISPFYHPASSLFNLGGIFLLSYIYIDWWQRYAWTYSSWLDLKFYTNTTWYIIFLFFMNYWTTKMARYLYLAHFHYQKDWVNFLLLLHSLDFSDFIHGFEHILVTCYAKLVKFKIYAFICHWPCLKCISLSLSSHQQFDSTYCIQC